MQEKRRLIIILVFVILLSGCTKSDIANGLADELMATSEMKDLKESLARTQNLIEEKLGQYSEDDRARLLEAIDKQAKLEEELHGQMQGSDPDDLPTKKMNACEKFEKMLRFLDDKRPLEQLVRIVDIKIGSPNPGEALAPWMMKFTQEEWKLFFSTIDNTCPAISSALKSMIPDTIRLMQLQL